MMMEDCEPSPASSSSPSGKASTTSTATTAAAAPAATAAAAPATAAEAATAPISRVIARSCHSCNRKKIRCDKKDPCTACTRAGRPCIFPPQGPRIRRTKKTIIADMSSRLAELEKALSQARAHPKSPPATETSTLPNNTSPKKGLLSDRNHLAETHHSREDVLVQSGSSSHYFNEVLLARAIREEKTMESVLTPAASTPSQPPGVSPFNAAGVLSSPVLSLTPASLHPPKALAIKLWYIYVDNVESCAGLKLLHIPTDEVKVFTVINNPFTASMEDLALAFAIYFASTTSLDTPETQAILPEDKNSLLMNYKFGLEQAYAHSDFLNCPTITGLHALAIYIAALRAYNRAKGMWILNGLAIRIAQSLGLHRDGKRLGLSPFQSEIRRRLWWDLLSRDSRAGEDYGIENPSGLLLTSDVDLPANINDSDLSPDAREPPRSRKGWTQMTFSLINIGLGKALQEISVLATSSSTSSPPSEEKRKRIIQEMTAEAEERLVDCNPIIPQQRLTLVCTRFLIRKTDFVSRVQWILLQKRAGLDPHFASERNLVEALEILEPRMFHGDEMLKQFSWTMKAYPQYHILIYVLLHLCLKPEGPNVERAWLSVHRFFEDEVQNGVTVDQGSKLSVLSALKTKALSMRKQVQRRPVEPTAANNECLPDSTPEQGTSTGTATSPTIMDETHWQGLGVGIDIGEWPDWADIVHGFQLDNPGPPWH